MSGEALELVEVIWKDAFEGPGGWLHANTYVPEPVHPHTVGFVLPDSLEDHITVCSSYFYDDEGLLVISNPNHIPRGMVLSITPISI